MVEKQMQTFFKKYLTDNPPASTEVYELKISKSTSIPYDAVQPHQVEALMKSERDSFYHKISDPPVFKGMNTKFNKKRPFDCFVLTGVKSFVVVWFYKPRQKKIFIKIPITSWLTEKNKGLRKSITENRALQIGEHLEIN